jgi:molybdenum cofactor cytidylyltransferase
MSLEAEILLAAAGFSRRMGTWKPGIEYKGRPLLYHSLDAAVGTGWPVTVIGGHNYSDLQALLKRYKDETPLENAKTAIRLIKAPDYTRGPGASFIAGLRVSKAETIFLSLGDMPEITTDTYRDLFTRRSGSACRPVYNGIPGHPVLIPQTMITEIVKKKALHSGETELSMRALIGKITPLIWNDAGVITDIDTPIS